MATTNEVLEQWFVCDGLVFTPGTGARWNCMTEDGMGVSVNPVGGGAAWDWSASVEWWAGVKGGTGQAATRDEAVRAAVQRLVDAGLNLEGLPRTDNEAAYGLAQRIQAALDQYPGQPFHVSDPTIDATFRYWTAGDAVAKADERGVTRFAYREGDGYRQVDKIDGQWWVRAETTPPWDAGKQPGPSDKALSSLQDELDRDALLGVQVRAEQRWLAGSVGAVDLGIDEKMARADGGAFQRIQNTDRRKEAATDIAANAQQYPAYKQSLDEWGRIKLPHGPLAEVIYGLDAENNKKIAAKEVRKAADFAAMKQDMRERAAAWSPQQAEAHARSDVDAFRAEAEKTERYYKASDMALNAAANPHYMKALGAVAPEIVQEVAMEKTKSLASDLSKIAMGEMYSDRVLRESVERLEALRDQPEHANPEITKDRINQALVHCKLALHGVRDTHHRLQDASWLIAVADGLEAEHGKSVPANEDPRWKAQMEDLKNVTASINAAMAPEAIKAEFDPAKLREYAEDVGMEFSGKVEQFDDGSMGASFTRDAQDGMKYHVALMVPAGGAQVTAHAALCKGEQVLAESAPMPRQSALGALDAAVASLDDLKVGPAAQATTQAEARALAERVAGEMGATLDDWVQSQAKEWVRTVMTTEDGKAIRLGASTGGVVSIEGDPFTPGADRALNVTHEAVSLSMQAAVARALTPHSPIKTDRVFVDAPGELGAAWRNLCEEENRLAGYLTVLEDGTAVVLGDEAWYLEKGDDGKLILMHGEVGDGKIKNPDSRFDFGLDWVDVELDEVRNYTQRVSSVADDFLIDQALWKTMKVEAEASPSMGM